MVPPAPRSLAASPHIRNSTYLPACLPTPQALLTPSLSSSGPVVEKLTDSGTRDHGSTIHPADQNNGLLFDLNRPGAILRDSGAHHNLHPAARMYQGSSNHAAIGAISSLVERAQAGSEHNLLHLLSIAIHDQLSAIRQQHIGARLQPARLSGQLFHHFQPDDNFPSHVYCLLS